MKTLSVAIFELKLPTRARIVSFWLNYTEEICRISLVLQGLLERQPRRFMTRDGVLIRDNQLKVNSGSRAMRSKRPPYRIRIQLLSLLIILNNILRYGRKTQVITFAASDPLPHTRSARKRPVLNTKSPPAILNWFRYILICEQLTQLYHCILWEKQEMCNYTVLSVVVVAKWWCSICWLRARLYANYLQKIW